MRRKIYASIVTPFLVPAAGPVAYSGPGDVVSGAMAWWGLRGYTRAYSTGSNPGIDVVDTATQLITTTINILANGALDVATIAALGYGVSVSKMYDQTGSGYHLVATAGTLPVLTLSGLGSLPVITFNGTSSALAAFAVPNTAQPVTVSAVANSTNNSAQQSLFYNSIQVAYNVGGASPNTANLYASGNLPSDAVVSDGFWHALQGIFNAASSELNVDGSAASTGAIGSDSMANSRFDLGSIGGSQWFKGKVVEMGVWTIVFSGANSSAMSGNQHTYWGF